MTTKEFKAAFEIAKSNQDLSVYDIDPFHRYCLSDFERVTVTIEQVAKLIRYQARYMSSGWDNIALDEIRMIGRNKFIVVGS